jgi:hypothetical protein
MGLTVNCVSGPIMVLASKMFGVRALFILYTNTMPSFYSRVFKQLHHSHPGSRPVISPHGQCTMAIARMKAEMGKKEFNSASM